MVERLLVVSPNWVGDAVMAMPALQLYRERHPHVAIDLVVKPRVRGLWELHPIPERLWTLEAGLKGTLELARRLRKERYEAVVILPNTFRAALLSACAGVRERCGRPTGLRGPLLTQPRKLPPELRTRHQAYEYADLLLPDVGVQALPPPSLRVPPQEGGEGSDAVVFLPGAARGPSKQWPPDYYAELGRMVGGKVLLLGTADERDLCDRIARAIGPLAVNMAGQTGFVQLLQTLATARVVVANDSGGMHLASAVGAPLVAVYGITDPGKTGPIGPNCVVLQESEVRSRSVAPVDPLATEALRRVTPTKVFEAILGLGVGSPS